LRRTGKDTYSSVLSQRGEATVPDSKKRPGKERENSRLPLLETLREKKNLHPVIENRGGKARGNTKSRGKKNPVLIHP